MIDLLQTGVCLSIQNIEIEWILTVILKLPILKTYTAVFGQPVA